MAGKLAPYMKLQFFDANGNPLAAGKLYAYANGTSNLQNTYQDAAQLTLNANPIILDAAGRPPAGIWLTTGQVYTFEARNSADVTQWSINDISGMNDQSPLTFDQWTASGITPTYVSASSFTVPNDVTADLQVGRRLKLTVTAGVVYGTVISSSFAVGVTTVVMAMDSTGLDAGISVYSYSILTPNSNSLPKIVSAGPQVCDGRLTLTSGTAVTTADVTAAVSVFFALYKGNLVSLFDGTKWVAYKFAELTLAVPNAASQMYDVFLKNVSGVLTLSALAWTNDTTRATALTTQDGVLVKNGDTSSRYLGSFRTTAVAGQTEDSLAKRYVWNYYNRARRAMKVVEATNTWTYTTLTYRQANAATANQLDFVTGFSEDIVRAHVAAVARNGTVDTDGLVGIGLDSTTVNSGTRNLPVSTTGVNDKIVPQSFYQGFPGVGRHTLVWLEMATAAGTMTWFGNGGTAVNQQSGIEGDLYA